MNNDKRYCIYVHIFPNNKVYVGQTCQKVERRWRNGEGYKDCTLMYNAIEKYKWNTIKHVILETNLTKEEANAREIYFINEVYKSNNRKFGYNLDRGGASSNCVTDTYWWNNGEIEKRSKECPGEGWIKGQLPSHHRNLCKKRIVNGEVFDSLKDVMRKLNVNKNQARILCGMKIKKDVRKKITIDGIEYPSIQEAHRKTGLSIRQIAKIRGTYVTKGYNYDRITKQCISVTINNVWYKSFTRAAKELGVKRHVIAKLYKEQGNIIFTDKCTIKH